MIISELPQTLSLLLVVAAGTSGAILGAVSAYWWHRRCTANRTTSDDVPFSPLFHAVAEASDAGLVILDETREVHYLNTKAEELLGVESQVAVSQGFITLVRDYQADLLVADVLGDGHARAMVLQPLLSGRSLRLYVAPIAVEQLRGVVLFVRDVTQLSLLERARRDMVVNVSHELRTPLASVKLLAETVQSDPPPEVAQRMLKQMAQEIDALIQLVDELHELSKIESGRVALKLASTPLEQVVTRAIERIRPQAERKSMQIHSSLPAQLPPVLVDMDRIGQVFLNLLHNAIKFTPEGGHVQLQADLLTIEGPTSCAQKNVPALPAGDWVLVSITDTGIGIPIQDLPRIFERFYKVDRARTRHSPGTGLGLAIAKHLVEGHGGKIWATSEEGAGSTFFLTLPVGLSA